MIGKITVGYGTIEQREIEIIDMVQASFQGNRLVSVGTVNEDEGIVAVIENPTSSGRNPQTTIWVSKESFMALIATAMIYFDAKGENTETLFRKTVKGEDIEVALSENLIKP